MTAKRGMWLALPHRQRGHCVRLPCIVRFRSTSTVIGGHLARCWLLARLRVCERSSVQIHSRLFMIQQEAYGACSKSRT
jgi:hypothetical protein